MSDYCLRYQEEGATELWLKYESLTFGLSQILFEELRLILLPTKAAQLK
jgi:midasin (ATPase involved in ribosome maturation)